MNKYELVYAKAYKKAVKKLNASDLRLVESVLDRLANDERLEPKYKDHALQGRLKGCRDCHIKPDLVLIYKKKAEILELIAIDIGSHSEVL